MTKRAKRKARWEAICHRCGLCCYERRVGFRGLAINTNAPCRYLDTETRLCTVYENRFQVCSECRKVTLLTALFDPSLPDSCGYVQTFRIWQKSSSRSSPR